MITVDRAADLQDRVGSVLGRSEWTGLPAERIAAFGALTGDEHWMHTDRDRAAREGPFGDVIAHGFLLLSLVTGLGNECYAITGASRWVNYGLERVRFTSPVVAGDRVRLELTLQHLEPTPVGHRLRLGCRLDLEHSERPAMVADWLVLVAEATS